MSNDWYPCPTMADVANAKVAKQEIEVNTGTGWKPWLGKTWESIWLFRARAPQPKKVKLLGWRNKDTGELCLTDETYIYDTEIWTRYTKLDDEVEE